MIPIPSLRPIQPASRAAGLRPLAPVSPVSPVARVGPVARPAGLLQRTHEPQQLEFDFRPPGATYGAPRR